VNRLVRSAGDIRMITFALHGYEGVDPAQEFGPLKAEFERRGVPCTTIRSPRTKTKTPNQDRARIMVDALHNVAGDVALIGISNQGLFMPLVAAIRPIKRIVFINGAIPRPGKSFWQTAGKERAFASLPVRVIAWLSPGMHEVCPLDELPKLEYIYIAAEHDEAIRPEWQQDAARKYLGVDPVVIPGAGHADIVLGYVSQVVDAALLEHQDKPRPVRASSPRRRQSFGQGLASFAISHFAPLLVYFTSRPYVANDTAALAAAWSVPLAWTVGASIWRRRLDLLGLAGVFVYGVALSVSVFFGAGALPLKLHRAVIAGALGFACLISVAIGRPLLLLLLAQRSARLAAGAMPGAGTAIARSRAATTLKFLTLIIGIACLANAALQTTLALTLSTAQFLIATTAIHVTAVIGIISGVALYLRFRR
jgi:hypothetical protein